MPLDLETIEQFFTARFELKSPDPCRELNHFDGYAHWSILCLDEQWLFISADRDARRSAFPLLEFAAYCSRVSTSHASGVGPVLIQHPNDTEETTRFVVFTRTEAGRISLSTSIGTNPHP